MSFLGELDSSFLVDSLAHSPLHKLSACSCTEVSAHFSHIETQGPGIQSLITLVPWGLHKLEGAPVEAAERQVLTVRKVICAVGGQGQGQSRASISHGGVE